MQRIHPCNRRLTLPEKSCLIKGAGIRSGRAMTGHTSMHTIDFHDVPNFDSTKVCIQLDDSVIEAIAKFPQAAERALCAAHFCGGIVASGKSLALRQGFMRASLAEFVGMEESLARDLLQLGIPAQPIKANASKRPLLHVIRELRNFELHLHSSPLTIQTRQAVYPAPRDSEPENLVDYQSWIIDDLTERQFLTLRNAKHYRNDDVPRLVEWFNAAQRAWGIHDVILRAVETFCLDISACYAV